MSTTRPATPSLATLTQTYLRSEHAADTAGDAVPHDGAGGFGRIPRELAADAALAGKLLGEKSAAVELRSLIGPAAVPFAIGFAPALTGDLSKLMALSAGHDLRPTGKNAVALGGSANDRATAAWLAGNAAGAEVLWRALPRGAVRSFNLGLCKLVADDYAAAAALFREAAAGLPESSSWTHYARFLAAWAESLTAA